MNESEVTRYEKFCQFRAKIRASGNYLIVGIDVAKDHFWVPLLVRRF